MKTTLKILRILLLFGAISSCTPNPIISDTTVQNAPSIYGTGGEQSAEPDNEKDG